MFLRSGIGLEQCFLPKKEVVVSHRLEVVRPQDLGPFQCGQALADERALLICLEARFFGHRFIRNDADGVVALGILCVELGGLRFIDEGCFEAMMTCEQTRARCVQLRVARP